MSDAAQLRANISLALDRFTLSVSIDTRAQVTGVFGPSGCGKTSFLETIAGIRRHAAGHVSLADEVWHDSAAGVFVAPEQRGIGYVPQEGLLFPHLTVHENLETGARRARRQRGDDAAVERELSGVVELLELEGLLPRDVRTLSGGERQRVALGRALCSAPRLLLLDEPLAALDQPLRRKILPFLRRVRDQYDVPMLLVSHDPLEVQALCDDVIVLQRGSIIAHGAPRAVLTDPAVFPLASERGFENVVSCVTLESDEWMTTVCLGSASDGPSLVVTNSSPGPRRATLVGIPARDVLVAVEEPKRISARNVLPAVVETVQPVDGYDLVAARVGDGLDPIVVEVGHEASRELALARGREVFLIIKAMSCTLHDETPVA